MASRSDSCARDAGEERYDRARDVRLHPREGRNEDGLLYSWFNPRTGEHSGDLCDTWGYDDDFSCG